MYAIISLQGQQFKAEPGSLLKINRLPGNVGDSINFDDSVLFVNDGESVKMGDPIVKGAKLEVEIVEHFRGTKITVFKMKRRKRYRRKQGHRQEMTKVRIKDIIL